MANNVYASCVSVDGQGVLLIGGSGTGKSDLALRLIMDKRRCWLPMIVWNWSSEIL